MNQLSRKSEGLASRMSVVAMMGLCDVDFNFNTTQSSSTRPLWMWGSSPVQPCPAQPPAPLPSEAQLQALGGTPSSHRSVPHLGDKLRPPQFRRSLPEFAVRGMVRNVRRGT